MTIINQIASRSAETDWFCPCCKSTGLHSDDMDLASNYHHSKEMRDHFGAVCCDYCADNHVLTEDGVIMGRNDALRDEWGGYWHDPDAMANADPGDTYQGESRNGGRL